MQWFATFAKLGGASLPSPGNPDLAIDGIDAWPVFEAFVSAKPVAPAGARKEVLIADNILRVGEWKYDSLYNQSFAHLFLLAAFRSKLLEYSCNLRLSRSLNHFR